MNILVADDDPGCVCLFQEVLMHIPDISIVTAGDGAEAWWWLTHPEMKYALVVLDANMPRVDGFDLIARMRLDPQFATLPVIMCTGITERRFIGKAAKLNISCYLMKPFSPETLYEKVESLLPHRSGRTITVT